MTTDFEIKKPHPSTEVQGQKWPEDAFVEWEREHYADNRACPEESTHCAFMAGIAYAEEAIRKQHAL